MPKAATKPKTPMQGNGTALAHAGTHPACGATTRSGRGERGAPCRQPAGFRTDHVGVGRCFLHGGRNPIKHGRYSGVMRQNIRGLIAQHEADPEPLNILPELAAARALVQDYVERYDEWRDALIAWHGSWGDVAPDTVSLDQADALDRALAEYEELAGGRGELSAGARDDFDKARATVTQIRDAHAEGGSSGKPRTVLDLADAVRMFGDVTKIAERIERVRAANAISRSDFLRVLTEMSRVVELCNDEVIPERRLEKIKHGWTGIRLS